MVHLVIDFGTEESNQKQAKNDCLFMDTGSTMAYEVDL
jgi:hypothetical protein